MKWSDLMKYSWLLMSHPLSDSSLDPDLGLASQTSFIIKYTIISIQIYAKLYFNERNVMLFGSNGLLYHAKRYINMAYLIFLLLLCN